MSLSRIVAETLDQRPNSDDALVAKLVTEAALITPDPADTLFPAVHSFVISYRRNRARQLEEQAGGNRNSLPEPVKSIRTASANDAAARAKESPGSVEDPALIARRALLAEKMYVPDKGYVTYGQMTADDFEARIGFLRTNIAGLEATISRYEEEITRLRSSGAKNLDELESGE